MTPIRHPACNFLLKSPPDFPDGACADLPVMRTAESVISFWEPTPEELHNLASGNHIICLQVSGATHPPLSLATVEKEQPVSIEKATLPNTSASLSDVNDLSDFLTYLWIAFVTNGKFPPLRINSVRRSLWAEAAREIKERAAVGHSYDPDTDSRVTWAREFISWSDGGKRPDSDLTNLADHLINRKALRLSRKELAAGETASP